MLFYFIKELGDYLKLKFGHKLILSAALISFIPLVLSYGIFIQDKTSTTERQIKVTLKDTAFMIIQNEFIKENLYENKELI